MCLGERVRACVRASKCGAGGGECLLTQRAKLRENATAVGLHRRQRALQSQLVSSYTPAGESDQLWNDSLMWDDREAFQRKRALNVKEERFGNLCSFADGLP